MVEPENRELERQGCHRENKRRGKKPLDHVREDTEKDQALGP